MSQHYFHAPATEKRAALVGMAGWDKPLQYFFLDVYRNYGSRDEALVYDNLEDATLADPRRGMTLAEIEDRLAELEVTPPPTLIANLQRDKHENAGNRLYHYEADGTFTLHEEPNPS